MLKGKFSPKDEGGLSLIWPTEVHMSEILLAYR